MHYEFRNVEELYGVERTFQIWRGADLKSEESASTTHSHHWGRREREGGEENRKRSNGEKHKAGFSRSQRQLQLSLTFCGKLGVQTPQEVPMSVVDEVCLNIPGKNYSEDNSFTFGKAS